MNFKNIFIVLISAALLASCGSASYKKGDKIAYKSSKVARPLDFPPDLTSDRISDAYALPSYTGPNTLSGYESAKRGAGGAYAAAAGGVLPQYNDLQIVRVGSQRFIQTSISPSILWPRIRDFWLKSGFIIEKESSAAGIMETNWAENRAELKDGPIRRILSKVIDSLYSTGTRDKFRTRLERNAASKKTEIIVSHQRLIEKLSGESTVWTPGRPMPELEGEMMARLIAHLGASRQQAAVAKAAYSPSNERARLINTGASSAVALIDDFANAWRRVGNALDRSGFAVEDRNRSAGTYYVRYEDPIVASQKQGVFSRMFGRKKPKVSKYIVHVRPSGAGSNIMVTDRAGRALKNQTSTRILKILHEQLR